MTAVSTTTMIETDKGCLRTVTHYSAVRKIGRAASEASSCAHAPLRPYAPLRPTGNIYGNEILIFDHARVYPRPVHFETKEDSPSPSLLALFTFPHPPVLSPSSGLLHHRDSPL